jgi:signal transduction histidine kinase
MIPSLFSASLANAAVLHIPGALPQTPSQQPPNLSPATRKIDSLDALLQERLKYNEPDETTVNLLNELAQQTLLSNRFKSLDYAQQAELFARRLNYRQGRALALSTLGNLYGNQGRYQAAIDAYSLAIRLCEGFQDFKASAALWTNLGTVYSTLNDYPQALAAYRRAQVLREQQQDKRSLAAVLTNIAQTFQAQKLLDSALVYATDGFKLRQAFDDKRAMAVSLQTMSSICQQQNNLTDALRYQQQAVALREHINDERGTASALYALGLIYQAQGLVDEALLHYQRALSMSERLGDKLLELQVRRGVAGVYAIQTRYNEALKYIQRSVVLADSLGARQQRDVSFKLLTDINNALYGSLRDSIAQSESARQLAQVQAREEAEQREREIELLTKDKEITALTLQRNRLELLRKTSEAEKRQQQLLLLSNEARIRDLQAAQERLRAQQTEQQLASLTKDKALSDAELQRQQQQRNYLLIVGAILLGMMALVYNRYRLQRRAEAILKAKNAELVQANQEILRQQKILEEQSAEIEITNSQLQMSNFELKTLSNEKSEMLGIVAHDLKNPLTGMIMGVSMIKRLKSRLASDEFLQLLDGQLERMESIIVRMRDIVGNLLDVNAIETGAVTLRFVELNPAQTLSVLADEYRDRAAQKSITIEFADTAEGATVMVDSEKLYAVLENLLSNAVKYSPHGTTVRASVMRCGNTVRMNIQDEGPGLTDEDKQKVFGKFARLSAQPTGGEHSTGLGLSIVKKLVELMHGSVWCESTFGEGATFTVEFPAVLPNVSVQSA